MGTTSWSLNQNLDESRDIVGCAPVHDIEIVRRDRRSLGNRRE
jgi:hypothetical protein